MSLLHAGFGNMINSDRIVAIVSAEAMPTKRAIKEAKESGKFIDATSGRKAKCAIVTDSDHVIAVAVQSETLAGRQGEGQKSQATSH